MTQYQDNEFEDIIGDIIAVYYIQNQRNLNDSKSRKCLKTPDLGHFGPILPNWGPGHFRKSGFVTFLDLLKANLMQKKSEKSSGGKYDD